MDSTASMRRWLNPSRLLLAVIVVCMLTAGAWIRTKDISADPLDVSHTQQLLFLLTAKVDQGPSSAYLPTSTDYASLSSDLALLQWVDARLAGIFHAELITVARWMSIIGWLLSSLLLYLLVRKLASPLTAVAVLAMMLFMPFSIQFSRVVLPGSWAMFFALIAVWQLWRWMDAPSWGKAVLFGISGSAAVLLHSAWLYILLGGLIAAGGSSRNKWRDTFAQVLFMTAVLLAPRLAASLGFHPSKPLFAFLGIDGITLGLSSVKQLVRLELRLESIVGVLGIGFAIFGVMLPSKGYRRSLLIGFWAGFAVMCVFFLPAIAQSIYTLYPVFLLASFSFIPLFEVLLESMAENHLRRVNFWILAAILIIAAGLGSIDGRRLVKANPEQIPAAYWRGVGEKLGSQAVFLSNTNSITLPLAYYGSITPACITASGDCLGKVDQTADQLADRELYFVFYKVDHDKVLEANPRLGLSAYRCDLGSGVMMVPLTANHPACRETGGQQ